MGPLGTYGPGLFENCNPVFMVDVVPDAAPKSSNRSHRAPHTFGLTSIDYTLWTGHGLESMLSERIVLKYIAGPFEANGPMQPKVFVPFFPEALGCGR